MFEAGLVYKVPDQRVRTCPPNKTNPDLKHTKQVLYQQAMTKALYTLKAQ